MINKWIQQDAIAIDDPVDLLVYQTRLVGSDDSLVIGGGGNTSLKINYTNSFYNCINFTYK